MKTIIRIMFTSILSAVAPTFAHAAYLQSHAAYQQNATQIGVTKLVPATRAVRGLDAMAYAPATFAQNVGWGNASTPGASVGKDDQSPVTRNPGKQDAFYSTKEHASRSKSQTTGYGNASAPGASVKKDDTTP